MRSWPLMLSLPAALEERDERARDKARATAAATAEFFFPGSLEAAREKRSSFSLFDFFVPRSSLYLFDGSGASRHGASPSAAAGHAQRPAAAAAVVVVICPAKAAAVPRGGGEEG